MTAVDRKRFKPELPVLKTYITAVDTAVAKLIAQQEEVAPFLEQAKQFVTKKRKYGDGPGAENIN